MAVSIVMPALEMAQETGKVVSWLKKEGDHVRKGEMLLEVETDKAVVEIESAGEGILAGVTAREGDVIPVGQTIAWLLREGETPPDVKTEALTGRRVDAPRGAATASMRSPDPTPGQSGPARISPRARKLAKERGVDLALVVGSGPGGEILADDVLKASAGLPGPPVPGPVEPMSSIGRLMAERTLQSWTTVPHFFVTRDVDATALVAVRGEAGERIGQVSGVRVTYTDLLLVVVARALRRHPLMNATWVDGSVVRNPSVNVALAIAVDQGVVTAVLHDADRAGLRELAARRQELAARARANRLNPADIAGGTFTVSNLGMAGVDAFTAIIVPPQAGILAVGRISDRVVARGGEPAVRPMLTMTLSADHRVVDGARAAAFLDDVVHAAEAPDTWAS